MIVFSFELPKGEPRGPIVLVAILEKENVDRMRQADPLDFQVRNCSGVDHSARLRDLEIVIAYEEDLNQMIEFQKNRDLVGFIKWLERGRKIQLGDMTPMMPLRKN